MVNVGDKGFPLRIQVMERNDATGAITAADLSGVTSSSFRIRRPDGTLLTKTATLVSGGSGGLVEYQVEDGDLNQEGEYQVQWLGVEAPWEGSSSVIRFNVGKRI